MIAKFSPLCSIDVVLWFGVGFGSKLWSKPARKARRKALKVTQNTSKRLEFIHLHGCPPLFGEVAAPLAAAGGRRGLVLDGWLVGFESGWSRREVERDIERYISLLKLKTEIGLWTLEATTGGMAGHRRPSAARGDSRGSGEAWVVVGRTWKREKM